MSTYFNGAPAGRNLGTPGYSYEFVYRLYRPLLERWGEVVEVRDPEAELARATSAAKARHETVVHLCFRAFQHFVEAPGIPNIVCPAWEFPDVPDHAFDGDPRNDWVRTSERCAAVMVGGPFTHDIFRRAGMKTDIHVVPVPSSPSYFGLTPWTGKPVRIDAPAYVFGGPKARSTPAPAAAPDTWVRVARRRAWQALRDFYNRAVRPLVPDALHEVVWTSASSIKWRLQGVTAPETDKGPLQLEGLVYSSILSPYDFRKNTGDLLTGFLRTFKDRSDVTLAIKLVTSFPGSVRSLLMQYLSLGMDHACRLVIIPGFLSEADMHALASATTYYLTTTRAEGNCLPLMDALASGRPAVSTRHTAIADYFSRDLGFVVESHPEPASWPHDSRHRSTTTWHRLVWPSLVDALNASDRLVRTDAAEYAAMGARARRTLAAWASQEAVWPKLEAALDAAAKVRPRGKTEAA